MTETIGLLHTDNYNFKRSNKKHIYKRKSR